MRVCSDSACDNRVNSGRTEGWCADHFGEIRFWRNVAVSDNCWEWTGSGVGEDEEFYGRFTIRGKATLVHRYSYTLHIGEIPEGLHIDHLCNNRRCVNPEHLEAVTQAENNRRRYERSGLVSECARGHPYTSENTYTYPNGRRACRECLRLNWMRYNRRKRNENYTIEEQLVRPNRSSLER